MRLSDSLLTDLYQLAMMDAYRQTGMDDLAVFEMFVRRMPDSRGFLMAAGLEQAVDYLEGLCFDAAELEWLVGCGHFPADFVEWLADVRFTGDVWALPEGEVFFADEPILRVEAPIHEAQLVESRLINILHYQTLVATKAARTVMAAGGRTLVDFGMRRAHGGEAAVWAARASYIGGFDGTATVEGGRLYGIPVFGTMAHSYIEAHGSEVEAFTDFARARPKGLVLLIDTYDVEAAVRKTIDLAPRLAAEGIRIRALRLDSGDLDEGTRKIRSMLDDAGLDEIGIFLSGNLDEYAVDELCRRGAPATGFGVGTRLDVSADAPALDIAYKLQAYAGVPRRKRSSGKATWPGRKQIYRVIGEDGRLAADTIGAVDECLPGDQLLEHVMSRGGRIGSRPSLQEIREFAAGRIRVLPEPAARLRDPEPVRAHHSDGLAELAAAADAAVRP
jgi:nicotinate phosphoribosyltransferase